MRYSKNYRGTFSTQNAEDMIQVDRLKDLVKAMNEYNKTINSTKRVRLCLRGRKPFVKEVVRNPWFGQLRLRSYDWGGNIVGGIKNAQFVDAYIYDR